MSGAAACALTTRDWNYFFFFAAPNRVGITERAVQRIVEDRTHAGYLRVDKVGRRNRYAVLPRKFLRHPVEEHVQIGKLLEMVLGERK